MGIFARLSRLIKANLNDAISQAEDPEKLLNQLVDEMSDQLLEAKKQVAVAIADEKRLLRQLEAERTKATEWERRAMLAVKQGDEGLAKEALLRKREHDGLTAEFETQWQKQKAAVESLKGALRALTNKIEEAKRKKTILIARKKRAEAQRSIQETMGGLKSTSAFEAFDRMAGKIDQMEAEAEATAELSEEYSGDTLAQKFQSLETTAGADDELLALKRKMGILPPEPAPKPLRVEPSVAGHEELDPMEAAELAQALAELEAEEQRALQARK